MNLADYDGMNQGNAPNPTSYDAFKQDFVQAYTQNSIRDFNYTNIVHGLCQNLGFNHVYYDHLRRALYAYNQPILLIQAHVHTQDPTTIGFECPYFPYFNSVVGTPDRYGPVTADRMAYQINTKLGVFLEGMEEYRTQDTKRFPFGRGTLVTEAGWVCESITQPSNIAQAQE